MIFSHILTFFLLTISINCYGKLEDHFKKAMGKSPGHTIRNIDFIYMINLDRRPEKFEQASKQLEPYGIFPYRFSAVNGWELTVTDINDLGVKFQIGMTPLMATTFPAEIDGKASYEFMKCYGKTYFCHCISRGQIGCSLSHISVLQDAWDAGYETIWVLEDDIEIVQDPQLIPRLIDKLDALVGKENWDVLFTDQHYRGSNGQYVLASGAQKRPDFDCRVEERYSEKYVTNQVISEDFKKVSARFGTHSMIIRRSGIQKLLEFAKSHQIYLPYDLENYFAKNLHRYSFTYDIVTNMLNSLSDM